MDIDSRLIFIVGPGGSGKSTAGKLLAERLGYGFVDLDLMFCERIGLVDWYIREHGYAAYCEANSALFDQVLLEHPSRHVFALSSGFLVHEDSPHLVRKHKGLLGRMGVSLLLLPSRSLGESMDVIIPRQMTRGIPGLVESRERAKLARRFTRYKRCGDVRVFSSADPATVAGMMAAELARIGVCE